MQYELSKKLAEESYKRWINDELFSLNWFILLITSVIFYVIWLKLLDKSKAKDFLLIGSLSAVLYLIGDTILLGFFGVAEYKVSITPFMPSLLIVSVTLGPVVIMLAQQFTSSWKGFLLLGSIGMAILAFVILPIYSLLGILKLHNWNYFYQFLYTLLSALMVRVVFLWIIRIEQRHHVSGN
ncbi:hypothetical protein [Clostridium sp.]